MQINNFISIGQLREKDLHNQIKFSDLKNHIFKNYDYNYYYKGK